MKKIILATSLATIIMLSGCGSDTNTKVAFNDVTIAYKSTAAYDLSNYLVPAQNQISNYVENEYTNESGKRDYSKTPDQDSPFYSATRFDVNGTTIKEFSPTTLDTTTKISTQKITMIDAEDNSSTNIARYADKGDYILKNEEVVESLGNIQYVCKLANHLDSKTVSGTTYNDIIEMTCTIDSYDSATVGGSKIEVTGDGSIIVFFAKNKGLITEQSDFCQETKTNGVKTTASCTKNVQAITTIN